VPRASGEPLLRQRVLKGSAWSQPEVSVISVPIAVHRTAIGALTIDLTFQPDRDCHRSGQFLGVVASMLGQAIGIQRLVEEDRRRLEAHNAHLHHELCERHDVANIVGTSGPMRVIYDQVNRLAGTTTPVLIRGESGTGKALIAHAIHYTSLRAKKPFINVSCAALSGARIESELFGHQGGAFAGADSRTQGRFELAEGGTLFLDEISHINASTQVRLLRFMQEHEFERLGGMETLKANVRVIAATAADLEAVTVEGLFLEQLYRTLNGCAIFVPPLRHRTADLLLLVDHFLEKLSGDHHKAIKRVSSPAIDALLSHLWPGNVRELANALAHAVRVCDGPVIHAHHLPLTVQTGDLSGTVSLHEAMHAYEADLIQGALRATRGNRARAARLLGTTQRILNYRVKILNINYRRFKR
jgi:Nif-specific regulatory protein